MLDRIAAGTLRAGERVPSENELVRELGVSRMTANRALSELAADGVLVRVAGVGTFVAEQRVHAHPLEVRNIADEMRAARPRVPGEGGGPRRRSQPRASLPSAAGSSPGRNSTTRCWSTSRAACRCRSRSATSIRRWPRAICDNDFTPHHPARIPDARRPAAARRAHGAGACCRSGASGRLLKLDADEACLLIMRRTFSQGRIASVADLYHPGSRYELAAHFQPR